MEFQKDIEMKFFFTVQVDDRILQDSSIRRQHFSEVFFNFR